MKELFTLNALPQLVFGRMLILLLIAVLVIWLYSIVRIQFSKLVKSNLRLSIKYAILEGTLLCILLLGIYMVLFFYFNGWQRFVWDNWIWSWVNTYFMLLPEIVVFIGLNIFYYVRLSNLSQIIKK
jgi:hypothetical protein